MSKIELEMMKRAMSEEMGVSKEDRGTGWDKKDSEKVND
jgi:hypothetical protein